MGFHELGNVYIRSNVESDGAGGGPHQHENAIHDNIADEIVPIEPKYDLVTTDAFIIEDSEDDNRKKSVSLAAIFGAGSDGVSGSAGNIGTGTLDLVMSDHDGGNSLSASGITLDLSAANAGDMAIFFFAGNSAVTHNAVNPAVTEVSDNGNNEVITWRILESGDPATWYFDVASNNSAFAGVVVLRGHDGLAPELLDEGSGGGTFNIETLLSGSSKDTPWIIAHASSGRGVQHNMDSAGTADLTLLWEMVIGSNFPLSTYGSHEAVYTSDNTGTILIENAGFSTRQIIAVGQVVAVDPGSVGGLGSGGSGVSVTIRDDAAIHDNVAEEISAIANKATPVGGDYLIIEDSEASDAKKHITISQLSGLVTDSTAIHTDAAGEIAGLDEVTTPADNDLLVIEDADDTNSKKKVQVSNLLAQVESPSVEGFAKELLMQDGVTAPPVPIETEAQDDWLYAD